MQGLCRWGYSIVVGCLCWLAVLGVAQASETIRHVNTNQKVVALTFDDGPGEFTPAMLEVLNRHQVKATFYVLGGNAKAMPQLIKAIIQQGHELGNHSMYHNKMKGRSVEAMARDIESVDSILRGIGYQGEITFRAPFGLTSDNLRAALNRLHKRQVLFTFLAQDWTPISAQTIYENVMHQLKPGLIITLHDGGKLRQPTIKATEMLIKTLHERGYRFLTISELLKLQAR